MRKITNAEALEGVLPELTGTGATCAQMKMPLLLIVLLSVSICCRASDTEQKELKLAFITCARDAQFFVPVKKGMTDAAALKENPDIRIVLATGQADTEAAGRAFEAANPTNDFWAAGFDLSPKILQLIQDDRVVCTIDQQPYIQGFYPVVQLTHYLRYGLMPSNIDAGAAIVDKSNAKAVGELTQHNFR